MNNVFYDLKNLIDYIQAVYTEVTEQWLRVTQVTPNLKRSLVSDVALDGPIYGNILEYVQLLNEKSADITLQLSFLGSCPITARVKARNSIEYKLRGYMTERHEYGKVPVNKCFNDLFGVRIVLESPLNVEEIRTFVEETYQGRFKCIDSSKNDYKAVHLYFMKDNRSFPWELQIWNRCDVENNFTSHKNYKQEYTTWEKESKEGGIING